jgi:two-component system, NtrC family, response regulator AtoC
MTSSLPMSASLASGPIPGPSSGRDSVRVLILEQEREILDHLTSVLAGQACSVAGYTSTSDRSLSLQDEFHPDVAFIDPRLHSGDGASALAWFVRLNPTVPTIAISCSYDPRWIVDAVRMGAMDVVVPPFDCQEVKSSFARCMDMSAAVRRKGVCEIQLTPNTSFVVCSDKMRTIASHCEVMAAVDLPVLILGESGTGKEIVAHYIHKMSAYSDGPFVKVNCAAMPSDLLESELLGYEQGAFTGAVKAKPGKFELSNHGTMFLDEIGEMAPALQPKLLQVLQDGTFSRLGGRTTIKVDARVIAATNIDIKKAIAEKRFREDLYYRINGFSLQLPPLRNRREEIPVLIRHFTQKFAEKYARRLASMSKELIAACMQYHWPGNLRELDSFVKRFLVLGDEQVMMQELAQCRALPVPPAVDANIPTPDGGLKKLLSNLKGDAEAKVIASVLQRNHWRRKKTAAELKISYKALLYKMRQHGIVGPGPDPLSEGVRCLSR